MLTEREQRNRRLAADLLTGFRRNDHDAILALCTDDCVFNIGAGKSQGAVPYHGTHEGHEKIRGYLRKRRANLNRDECLIKPVAPGAASRPEEPNDPDLHWDALKIPLDERFVVHGSVVVAVGHLRDSFNDGKPMHETDFAIVFQVDQAVNKISGFHYILDNDAVADAWQARHGHAAHNGDRSAGGH